MLKKKEGFDKKEIIPIIFILSMFIISFYLYKKMPDEMPIHWDFEGNVDGYGSKFSGLLLIPIITAGLYLIISLVPRIAIYKKNIKSFYFYFFAFKIVFVLFMFLLYILTLLPNFGVELNMNRVLIPLISVMIYFSGILMEKSKRNYFIGIRTPWTLQSDYVWNKTHKLGAKGFKIISVIMLMSLFIGKYGLIFSIGILLLFTVFIVLYSYKIYQNRNEKKL